jgi:hypothetical protein
LEAFPQRKTARARRCVGATVQDPLAARRILAASDWHGRMGDIEGHAWDWRHFMPWEDYLAWREKRQASR